MTERQTGIRSSGSFSFDDILPLDRPLKKFTPSQRQIYIYHHVKGKERRLLYKKSLRYIDKCSHMMRFIADLTAGQYPKNNHKKNMKI